MINDLTKSEKKVFNAIAFHIKEKNYPPSIQELCALTGLKSTSTIYYLLLNLKAKGVIDFQEKSRRTISIKRSSK